MTVQNLCRYNLYKRYKKSISFFYFSGTDGKRVLCYRNRRSSETAISELEKIKINCTAGGTRTVCGNITLSRIKKDANKSFEYYDEYVEASTKCVKEKTIYQLCRSGNPLPDGRKAKTDRIKKSSASCCPQTKDWLNCRAGSLSLLALMLVSFYRNKKENCKALDKKTEAYQSLIAI